MANEPIHKAQLGRISVAVWENESKVDDGVIRTFHTVTLERSYKDKDDNWQTTQQLGGRDIGDAIALLQNVQQLVLLK